MDLHGPAVHDVAQNHDDIDPVTLEVVCGGLRTIVKEMRATIIRASFSSVICDLDDFSCVRFNPRAEIVAQSDGHPGHVMPMPWSVRCAMEDLEGSIDEGDVVVPIRPCSVPGRESTTKSAAESVRWTPSDDGSWASATETRWPSRRCPFQRSRQASRDSPAVSPKGYERAASHGATVVGSAVDGTRYTGRKSPCSERRHR